MSEIAPSSQFFEEDDEETLELLVDAVSSDDDMINRLDGTCQRFLDDSKGTSDVSFWKCINKSAEELGFRETGVSSPPPAPRGADSSSSSFPAAFETDAGKKHIQATSSLLRISKTRAVKLTLSALRSLNGGNERDETHLQSLLGTRALLKTVRAYHFQQRTSRLQVIIECLRIEQDDESPNNQAATSMLDDLDKIFMLDGRKRGLFQQLLCVACAPFSPPTRDELLPALELRSETPENLANAQLQYANGAASSSDAFVTDCFQAARAQTLHERMEALEALLVLFYHRIDQGIHRNDYVLVLLAFQSCGTFFTSEGNKRLSYLAGLITAECMSLWMTNSDETDAAGSPLWVVRHPILVGVVEGNEDQAVREMEVILMLLTKYAGQVPDRKLRSSAIRAPNGSNTTDAPESIALFSFALLLCLVKLNLPGDDEAVDGPEDDPRVEKFDFGKHGMDCAQIASDDCGVFDYLHTTMEALVKTPILDSFSSESDIPYDWQFSDDSSPLRLEGPSEQEELNAASVAYSSIGLELLSSTIIAFQGTIRSGNCISVENVTMLCNLAATIYGNHPLLCETFWRNLAVYTSGDSRPPGPMTSKHALCYLVDAAHACATSALNAVALATVGDSPGLEENILPSLFPLLQLMSALCSNPAMVESVLKLLPKSMIRIALLCCAPTSSVNDIPSFTKNALQIVESVKTLARVGRSSNCRDMLRKSLEEEGSDIVDGPRVLYRIISSQPSPDIMSSTLRIFGYFVESSGGHDFWITKGAKYFGSFGLGENGLPSLLTSRSRSVVLSGLHVLSGFVGNMSSIAFCPAVEQTDVLGLLEVVEKGVTASCMLLTTLLSSTPTQSTGSDGQSYLVAHGALRCSAMFLRELRPIINMHSSLGIKSVAEEARAILLQGLSTSTPVGQAIAYFASAPISLSLVVVLDEMLQNAKVMQIASDEYVRETDPLDFGAWRSVADASRENKPALEISKVRSAGQDIVNNIHELDVDLRVLQTRAWTDETTVAEPLLAASAALDLLRLWSLTASDTVVEKYGISKGSDSSLDQDAASELQSLSPCRLIFSDIIRPPFVERSSSLGQVWPARLSLFDILPRYMAGADDTENGDVVSSQALPTFTAADIMALALTDARQFSPALRFSIVDAVVRSAPKLSFVLSRAIGNTFEVTSASGQARELLPEDDLLIRRGLASLRLLSSCLELDIRVVAEICKADRSPVDGIISILNSTATTIRRGTSLAQIFTDPSLSCQLRLVSAAVYDLLILWKASCATNANKGVIDVVAAFKENVVSDLFAVVEFAALELATDVLDDPKVVHVISLLDAAASSSLDILTEEMNKELVHAAPGSNKKVWSMVSNVMESSFSSLSNAFSKIDAAVMAAKSWSTIVTTMQSSRSSSVNDPLSVLCAFPAAFSSLIESHAYQENLCDIVATLSWVSPLQSTTGIPPDALKTCNASFVCISKQLALVKSWGRFALMFSLEEESVVELAKDVTLSMARTVLKDLGLIANVIEEAQMLVSGSNFLPYDVATVSNELAGLLFEKMSSYARDFSSFQITTPTEATKNIVEMLVDLHRTTEKLLSSTNLNRPSHHVVSVTFPSYLPEMRETIVIREETLFMSAALQKRLLAAANLCFTILDQAVPTQSKEISTAEIALRFVEAACKGLDAAGSATKVERNESQACRLLGELLDTKVSLLTVLLSKERGSRSSITGNSQFYASSAALMKRSNVMQSLVMNVHRASEQAVSSAGNATSGETRPADENQVEIVQTILSFVRTIAEIGNKSDDMLSLLSSTGLFRMIVDNPLFQAANHRWVSQRDGADGSEYHSSALRGYLPSKDKVPVDMAERESKTIVTGTFLSGRNDPTHAAWSTALQILQATVSGYSKPHFAIDNTSKQFLDCVFAFLRKYYTSLIACLKQCSSLSSEGRSGLMPGTATASQVSHTVLTFNTLGETTDILALVSSLCCGRNLQEFENTCGAVFYGMISACHAVLDGLGEFLAAAGTAREIFAAMKDHDAKLEENANREGFEFPESQAESNPLVANGIPNARHEAIKHAHYASRCCALVTPEDYKGLPSASETSTDSTSFSTSKFEKDSRLSLSSPFMIRMEIAAAESISFALSVLSQTHPASSCFVVFSPEEVRRHDMLSLVKEGMIISALSERDSDDESRFYRILYVDTVRRRCHVRSLDEQGEDIETIIAVDQVNGIEDMSKRSPILTFSAAPTSFVELESAVARTDNTAASIGDLIAVLRWCYQCGVSSMDSESRRMLRKVVAESASVLLGTEVSLHKEIGTFSTTIETELSKRVLAQLLQLFDDSQNAPVWSGKLKQMVEPSVWNALQQQLREELQAARNDRREKVKSLNRAAAVTGPGLWTHDATNKQNASQPWQ